MATILSILVPPQSRGRVFRFTRPFCESALRRSTHEDRSLGPAHLFHDSPSILQRIIRIRFVYRSCCGTRDNRAEELLREGASRGNFDRNEALQKLILIGLREIFENKTCKFYFQAERENRDPTLFGVSLSIGSFFSLLQHSLASSFDETKSVATTVASVRFIGAAISTRNRLSNERSSSHGVCIDGTIISHYHRPRGVLGPRKRSDRA